MNPAVMLLLITLLGVIFQHGSAKICTNQVKEGVSHTLRGQLMRASANDTGNYFDTHLEYPYSLLITSSSQDDHQYRRTLKELQPQAGFLEPISLHEVRLAPDSPQGIAQQTNLEYLLYLEPERLAYCFRKTAGIDAPGTPYGGWEEADSEIRGHFVGHYLSATALMWASTHNETIKEKMTALVDALGEAQTSDGYVSAFPTEFFDRAEDLKYVWAPYYTIHKVMAGLLDQYIFAGNEKALNIVSKLADYFSERVRKLIEKYTVERHYMSINEEFGGMNDLLYQLYTFTKNPEHLKLAHLFDKPCFLGLLAVQADSLAGFHANTHIPIVVGAQQRYEIVGDGLYKDISHYFMDLMTTSHTYATGGTSNGEFWTEPNRLATALSPETGETCATYNLAKIARNLFRYSKDMPYLDYYERAMTNALLSVQRGQEPGIMLYMVPMVPGGTKAVNIHGWGTKNETFWCCYGTGVETFAKLGDSIYYQDNQGIPAIYVTQFVSSTVNWKAAGLKLQQVVQPLRSYDPKFTVTYKITEATSEQMASLHLRVPFWADCVEAIVNGENISLPSPGTFLELTRKWGVNDTVTLVFSTYTRTERIADDREEYKGVNSIFYGHTLLAGLSEGDWNLGPVNVSTTSEWIVPVPQSYSAQLHSFEQHQQVLSFANGRISMIPAPKEGTNEAVYSAFRVASPVVLPTAFHAQKTQDGGELLYNVVSLEIMSRPGSFISHNGVNKPVGIQDYRYTTSLSAVFQILPGISGDSSTVSFEAAGHPGCFLCADKFTSDVSLRCRQSGSDFEKCSSFSVKHSLSTYHPMSFIAHGTNRSYLLFPLNAYKDEQYTVYFDMS